jgi:hypothetical protein
MAIQTIQNGINLISVDDTKYVINTYNENTGYLEVVNIVNPETPFVVCRIYAGITHWVVTPLSNKFNKSKSTGIEITLD